MKSTVNQYRSQNRSPDGACAGESMDGRIRQCDIVALCGQGALPEIMVNAIIDHIGPVTVIREQKEPSVILLKRRRRMLGILPTAGQAAFGLYLKLLQRISAKRVQKIIDDAGLRPDLADRCRLIDVDNVNSDACRIALRQISPKVVFVAGTRMIRRPTLTCIDVPFINYHAGTNPSYRGMNGGYWALSNNDKQNAGVTVHLLDEGVDTGAILYLDVFQARQGDNFATYPYLQASVGRPLVIKALSDALDGNLTPISLDLPSKQWFHPTLWSYFWNGLTRGVW